MLRADGDFDTIPEADRAARIAKLAVEFHTNTYDEETGAISLSSERHNVIQEVQKHYRRLLVAVPTTRNTMSCAEPMQSPIIPWVPFRKQKSMR